MNRHRDPVRRAVLCVLAGLATAAVSDVRAQTRISRLALNGFDPVSFFLPGGPQAGSTRFETEWNGRAWRFALEANRAAFVRNPAVYAPRLGGFDAAGVLDKRLVDADPTQFAVLAGRLYLFRDADRRARFVAEPDLARQAEAIWPTLGHLLDDPVEGMAPMNGAR